MERSRRGTRVRAILAGGLVLGVGTAVTLAAWTDEEHVTADFTAGQFGIVGSADGATFENHDAQHPAKLPFTLGAASSNMGPGDTVYQLYAVQPSDGSTLDGTVQLMADESNDSGLGEGLTYAVKAVPDATCDAVAFTASEESVVPVGSPLTTGQSGSLTLSSDDAPIYYCFRVSLPQDADPALQGQAVDADWVFVATTAAA